jgi:hypothetical protein
VRYLLEGSADLRGGDLSGGEGGQNHAHICASTGYVLGSIFGDFVKTPILERGDFGV